jgi:hypothetical protein
MCGIFGYCSFLKEKVSILAIDTVSWAIGSRESKFGLCVFIMGVYSLDIAILHEVIGWLLTRR